MSPAVRPDWDQGTVGGQFDVQLGKMLDAARNVGEPKPYLGNRAVRWGAIDVSAAGTVPMTQTDLSRYRLRRGDLLVCEGGEVGRAAIWRNELPECYYQKALHRLRPKYGYDVRLMLAFLEYWSSVGGFANYITQTSIAHLPRDKFIQMPLPLPDASEQECLGDVVDDLNAQIAALERLITKKQAIKQGMMQQLLTGRTRLPGCTEPWTDLGIFELADNRRELFNDGDWVESPHITTTGNRLLQTGNIGVGRLIDRGIKRYVSDDSFRGLKCKDVVPGDILICRLADPAGRACIVRDIGEKRMLTSVDVTIFRPDTEKADRRFLIAAFSTPGWFRQVSDRCGGSTRTRIARSELGRIKIRLPSLREQVQIADALTDADQGIVALEERLTKTRAIKQGMMQQLLTGRTRLPVPEP